MSISFKSLIIVLSMLLSIFLSAEMASAFFKKESETDKLLRLLTTSPKVSERADAAWRLGKIGDPKVIPSLGMALGDESAPVRANAATSLWRFGDQAKSTMPALRQALNDPSFTVIANAAMALRKMGIGFKELEPAYRRLLGANRCKERVRGLKQLQGKTSPQELFPVAMDCTYDKDISVSNDAHGIIGKLTKVKNLQMAAMIVEGLKAPSNSTTVGLIYAIAKYTPPVKEAVDPLIQILSTSHSPQDRNAAANVLGRMGTVSLKSVPVLAKSITNDPDQGTRAAAAEAIGNMGTKAASAIPALMAGIKDKWPIVRRSCIRALGNMGVKAQKAIPLIKGALDDPDMLTKNGASFALSKIDPKNVKQYRKPKHSKAAAVVRENLLSDPATLVAAMQNKLPVVLQMIIYPNFATIAVLEQSSADGIASYIYRGGGLLGPRSGPRARCMQPFKLADVDFSVLPQVVSRAPKVLGGGTVRYVFLDGGPRCRNLHWTVYVRVPGKPGDQSVEYGLDGKRL